jgi:eukaryotic-like serine/threonine-protein kinase
MEPGQTIVGKYRLSALLGMGGMASVWSATNVYTERQFAIKFMLPQVARTQEAVHRFMLEAKVSARINHPNIIEVIDVGQTEDGTLFLVMELLTGASLDAAVCRAHPPMLLRDFLLVMRDVAHALAAAHRSGVIHRDLKPTNVFLHRDRDGRVVPKVLDFGVSKVLEGDASGALTVDGTILGSPLYMSPEQAVGADGIDGRTDVFAFGAMLFEALCGQRAYSGSNLNALIVTIATTEPRPIEELAPHLPDPLRDLVRDCMVTDRAKRLASFEPVVDRLDDLISTLADSDQRLPVDRDSRPASDSVATGGISSRRRSDGLPPSARRVPSVAPHSLPTPDAPRASPDTDEPRARGWAERRSVDRNARNLAWIGGSSLAAVALLIGLAALFVPGGGAWPWTAASLTVARRAAPQPATAEPTAPPATASDSVPIVTVDSLPAAARSAAALHGNGWLSVATMLGWCAISVDGTARGVTPLATFELPAGAHKITCVSPDGKAKATTVTVNEGSETHYQFAFAE